MIDWQGRGASLPVGFAVLRAEFKTLQCSALVWLTGAGPDAQRLCGESAVQLLCRALRLSSPSYRRFELAAAQPFADNQQLRMRVCGDMRLIYEQEEPADHVLADAAFDSVAALSAAMVECAAAENLTVPLSTDQRSIIVVNTGNQL